MKGVILFLVNFANILVRSLLISPLSTRNECGSGNFFILWGMLFFFEDRVRIIDLFIVVVAFPISWYGISWCGVFDSFVLGVHTFSTCDAFID